jgi:sec-independent protein translocase protein TatA
MAGLQGWHLVVLIAIVLLLFGAPKLPGLARSLGQSMRIFRSEVKTMKTENADESGPETLSTEIPKTASHDAQPKP